MRTPSLAASLAALLLVAAPSAAHARKYQPQGRPVPYEGFHAKFPSGMQLVVYEAPQVDRFSVTVSYGSGSAEDPKGKEGLAHFAEHLAFRAAPAWAGGARIWDLLLRRGFEFNASTSPDQTDFYEIGKPGELRAALALEAARMRDPLAGVTEDDLSVERDVVVSEYRERFETRPEGAELEWVLGELFPGHPYGRSPSGTPGALRGIALADVRAWTHERYAPENAIVVVISPRKAREVAGLVAEVFGDLAVPPGGVKREPVARPVPPPPPVREDEIAPASREAPVRQPVLWVAWAVPGDRAHQEPQAAAVADALEAAFWGKLILSFAGNEMQSTMFVPHALEVVERAQAGYLTFAGAGLLYLRLELGSAGDAGKVADLVKSAAFELRQEGLAQLDRRVLTNRDRANVVIGTRSALLVDGFLAMEGIDGAAVAKFLRATGVPDYLGGWQKMVALQLNFDITRYTNDHLRREQAAVVLVKPDKNPSARDPRPAAAARGERIDEAGEVTVAADADAAAVMAAPGLDRAARRVLPNGLTAVVLQKGALPIAEVALLLKTHAQGTAPAPAGLPGMALASNAELFSGNDLSLVGARRDVYPGEEELVHRVRGASSNLQVLLEATGQWARDQQVRYFDETKEYWVARTARLERDEPSTQLWTAVLGALYPDHPYGRLPSAARLEQVRSREADAWLSSEVRPERATLLVVSDQAPTPELWGAIEDAFGGWGKGDVARVAATPPPLPTARRVLLLDRPGASQAVVVAALRGPPVRERDEAASDAVRWLLQDRLQQRIRVEEGVSYGVNLGLLDHEQASSLVAIAAVDRDAAGTSLATLLGAARALAEKPLAPAEVARARWQVARRFARAFDTVAESVDALAELSSQGLPPDHFEKLPASIAALDAARIQAAAARLAVGKEVVVVQGDAAALRPKLEKAGFQVEAAKPAR